MLNKIPKIINPWLLARNEEELVGTLNIADMPILLSSQLKEEGLVYIELKLGRREDKKLIISGAIKTELQFSCQRCLGVIPENISIDIYLVIVKSEGKLGKLEGEDGFVCDEELEMLAFVEQELILMLPMIAKHDDCDVKSHKNVEAEKDENPFAELKKLIK